MFLNGLLNCFEYTFFMLYIGRLRFVPRSLACGAFSISSFTVMSLFASYYKYVPLFLFYNSDNGYLLFPLNIHYFISCSTVVQFSIRFRLYCNQSLFTSAEACWLLWLDWFTKDLLNAMLSLSIPHGGSCWSLRERWFRLQEKAIKVGQEVMKSVHAENLSSLVIQFWFSATFMLSQVKLFPEPL